jgi:hypothetical protein
MAQSVNSIRALEEYLRHGTMLRSTTNPEYSAAIQAIEYIQSAPTEVVPMLSRLAADQELDCGRRMVAVSFLVTTRAPQAESTLVGLLEDPHPLIQTVALGALARAQSQSPVFFKKLKEAALQWDNEVLVEEFIRGMEVTCGVIGTDDPTALTPSETIPTADILSLEDKFLYGQGENKTPARLPADVLEKVRETARKTYVTLGLKVYARIDMFVRDDGDIVVLEPNSLPGMTPSTVLFHQAAESGISQSGLMDRIIQYSLEIHRKKKGPL